MTLVELLVVVAIIVLLLAISVPLLKPMLESRRTANAAQVLAGAFQQARMKSIQEGQSYGIKLVPFRTVPTASVQLRLQKSTPIWVNSLNIRVVVRAGTIVPCCFWQDPSTGETEWRDTGSTPAENAELDAVKQLLIPGYAIQFNRIGRWFTIGVNDKLASPYNNLDLPEDLTGKDALEYCISAMPTLAWIPQTVMPRGTIVDLAFSGGETVDFAGGVKMPDDIPVAFSLSLSNEELAAVTVMFSPAGHVDALRIDYIDYSVDPKGEEKVKAFRVNEMLYFCVGEWDRQVDANGNSLAEDKKSNFEVPATYWVTIHPKTGEVRIAENAPIGSESNAITQKLDDARKFAKKHFFNVGGF